MTATDFDLLQGYAREGSDEAFEKIVERHSGLVYSAAFRQVRIRGLAEEVTQSVFCDLARTACRLRPETILSTWLYQVTRRTAIDIVRRESRRKVREEIGSEIAQMNEDSQEWIQIESLLDEAMEGLAESERTAILLRFFENKKLNEVGLTLGITEDAAQKRVSRGVERLRQFFSRRGILVSTASLAALLASNAVQAVPIGLIPSALSAVALLSAPAAATATAHVGTTIVMITIQKTLLGVVIVAGLGGGIYEARRAAVLQQRLESIQREQAPLQKQLNQLRHDWQAAQESSARFQQENARLRKDVAELPKLRGQLSELRSDSRELREIKAHVPFAQTASAWKEKEARLRSAVTQTPGHAILELELLAEGTWFDVARDAELDTELGIRKAMSRLRFIAENQFAESLRSALEKYTQAHDGLLPNEVKELAPFFNVTPNEACLDRYTLLHRGKAQDVPERSPIITQKTPIDEEIDFRWQIGVNWFSPVEFKRSIPSN